MRQKAVSPDDLLEAAIERLEVGNPAINAVVMPLYDFGVKSKGTVAPLSSSAMAAAACCARTPSSSAMRRSIGFIVSELFI